MTNSARFSSLSISLGYCLLTLPFAYADDIELAMLSETEFLNEIPIVLSASRLKQSAIDSPAPTTIIDRSMIEASGAIEITDVLRLVPGFQVAHRNGTEQTATYHGISDQHSRRMQVLIDGRSVFNPAFSGVTWNSLPITLGEIDRIEVVRGPNAATYGSNAFLGVINIITRHSIEDRGISVQTLIGSNNKKRASLTVADNIGELDYRLVVEYDHDKGFDNVHDSHSYRTVNFRGDYSPTQQDTFLFETGVKYLDYQNGFEGDFLQADRNAEDDYNYQQVVWTRHLAHDDEIKFQLFHNSFNREDNFNSANLSQVFDVDPAFIPAIAGIPDQALFVSFNTKFHRYNAELQHTLHLSPELRLAWGGGLRYDTASEHQYLISEADRTTASLFVNAEWQASDQLTLNAGLVGEQVESLGFFTSPRLSANFHISPQQTIRISASRAYRMPSFFDQSAFFHTRLEDQQTIFDIVIASPLDIKPERIDAYEIGYIGQLFNSKTLLDINFYHHRLRDLISTYRVEDLPGDFFGTGLTYDNNGNADITGIDAQLRFVPTPQSIISLSYSYAHTSNSVEKTSVDGSTSIPLDGFVPQHTFSLLGSYMFANKVQTSAVYYFNDSVDWRGEGDDLPSYSRLDLRVGKNFKYKNSVFTTNLIVQNALGNDYLDFNSNNIYERRIFLELGLNFQ